MWSLNRVHKGQKGITGLETAIILIAFVVVASIFAYTVLSAGLFSSQKSQEAVYNGLKTAQSTLELKGAVVATAEPTHTGATGYVGSITFTVGEQTGGQQLDFTDPTASGNNDGLAANDTTANNPVIISYIDKDQRVDNLMWTKVFAGKNNGDEILDPGEAIQITIGSTTHGVGIGNLTDALAANKLVANKTFTIEVQTGKGSVLTFSRTIPATVDSVMTLN